MCFVVSDEGELLLWQCSKARPDCTHVSLFYWLVVCLNGLRGAWEPHRTVEISRPQSDLMEDLLRSLWGVWGGFSEVAPITSQKLPVCGNHQTQRILGQLLRSLLQNSRNFSEVASEVRPAVHTALLPKHLLRLFFALKVIYVS